MDKKFTEELLRETEDASPEVKEIVDQLVNQQLTQDEYKKRMANAFAEIFGTEWKDAG